MTNQVALVTGAGRGIGRAICTRLARDGWAVAGLARNERELGETGSLVSEHGGEFLVLPADVCDPEQVDRAVSAVVDKYERLDLLVNNAGVAPFGKVAEMPLEVFDRCVQVNVNAVFYCCQRVLPIMAGQGGGAIINVSSMAATDPFPGFGAYGATKAWVNTFTRALADEVAQDGIRVFAIAPGAVETAMLRGAFPDFPAEQTLDPADVADLVTVLLDSRCQHTSGQVVQLQKRG